MKEIILNQPIDLRGFKPSELSYREYGNNGVIHLLSEEESYLPYAISVILSANPKLEVKALSSLYDQKAKKYCAILILGQK